MIVRIQNAAFLLSDPVLEFLGRAYKSNDRVSLKADLAGILPNIADPKTGVFAAIENSRFCGFAVVFLPTSPIYDTPQVHYLYNDGSKAARDELVKAIIEYVTGAGYNRFWGINLSGKSDKVYLRTFGVPGAPIGSILEFDLNKKEEQEDGSESLRGQQRERSEPKLVVARKHDPAGVRGDAEPVGDKPTRPVQRRTNIRRNRKRRRAA